MSGVVKQIKKGIMNVLNPMKRSYNKVTGGSEGGATGRAQSGARQATRKATGRPATKERTNVLGA